MRVLFELISELLYFPILKPEDAKRGKENSRFTFCVQNAGDSGLVTPPAVDGVQKNLNMLVNPPDLTKESLWSFFSNPLKLLDNFDI